MFCSKCVTDNYFGIIIIIIIIIIFIITIIVVIIIVDVIIIIIIVFIIIIMTFFISSWIILKAFHALFRHFFVNEMTLFPVVSDFC